MSDAAWVVLVVLGLVYSVSLGGFCAWLAREKGRNVEGWFVLGVFFGFIALIAIAGAPGMSLGGTARGGRGESADTSASESSDLHVSTHPLDEWDQKPDGGSDLRFFVAMSLLVLGVPLLVLLTISND